MANFVRERWSWFPDIGCLPCRKEGRFHVPPDTAHETQGGRRTGHEFTFPCCPYHHRGELPDGMDSEIAAALYGPSFAYSKRSFELRYGTELELAQETDALIANLRRQLVG
jgi:Recombination enhancement, RecA-dependent nuclease